MTGTAFFSRLLTGMDKVEPEHFPFENATVYSPADNNRLSASRAYTLSLSPQLIYARSQLLPALISSKVYKQLEFLAIGSWWIHKPSDSAKDDDGAATRGRLYRVPSSREDIFADDLISVKSKRTLMRFLRSIGKPSQEDDTNPEDEVPGVPLSEYLVSKFHVPDELFDPLLSLSLSQSSHGQTSAAYAVPRIKRHLASIGVFGPGFGSLMAKWGGSSEISQVGCRALAVGGGIYVLGTGIKSIEAPTLGETDADALSEVRLTDDTTVRSRFVVGSNWELPAQDRPECQRISRSITIVSSPLESLFPVTAEGGPVPAGAVIVFPGNTLGQTDDAPPVYILVHSSETGECPLGQCELQLLLISLPRHFLFPYNDTIRVLAHMMTISQKNLSTLPVIILMKQYGLIMSPIALFDIKYALRASMTSC